MQEIGGNQHSQADKEEAVKVSGQEKMMGRRIQWLDRLLFCPEDQVQRQAMIWNTILSFLNALQSALLLFVVSRTLSDVDIGIFSFAFSVAYLMIMIGNYGVRNYQATDVKVRFGFKEYLKHRVMTCIIMTICSVGYVVVRGYDSHKAWVVLLCCILKVIESVENVYHSEYQRGMRLEVAGKIGTVRFICCMIAFLITLFATKNLVSSFLVMDIVALLMLIIPIIYTYPKVTIAENSNADEWWRIFFKCFPLFLSSFFNIYICNASKYAIDKYSDEVVQGYYGMIFMPVFVINLISNCIYGPHLVGLAKYWADNNIPPLKRFVRNQIIIVIIVTLVIIVGAYICGIQVMSLFFGKDLKPYKMNLLILLLGGGMTALVDFMNNIITVIRKQKILVWVYGFISLASFIITPIFVKNWGIDGAANSYTLVLAIQAVVMTIYVLWAIKSKKS
ncbi:MAG: lipopolysaccharide biosynthesis protein [Eubacterium sp.]|nr:lipopolysaccharide biosynthesis protein [Eubacterium sp.]